MEACPAWSSAREALSAQSLSPTVTGRFLAALPQSPSPPGWKDTVPSRKLMRATRDGGSPGSGSSARAVVVTKAKQRRPASDNSNLDLPTEADGVFIRGSLFCTHIIGCGREGARFQ